MHTVTPGGKVTNRPSTTDDLAEIRARHDEEMGEVKGRMTARELALEYGIPTELVTAILRRAPVHRKVVETRPGRRQSTYDPIGAHVALDQVMDALSAQGASE